MGFLVDVYDSICTYLRLAKLASSAKKTLTYRVDLHRPCVYITRNLSMIIGKFE